MKRLILHIGMPKSASSTIQNFIARYENELHRDVYVPSFLGSSNHRLIYSVVKFEFREDDPALRLRGLRREEEKKEFIKRVRSRLDSEFRGLKEDSLTIISCEQLASLSEKQVLFLRSLLEPYFNTIEVVCYFKRQDLMVVSGYSTQIISGRYQLYCERFSFPNPAPNFMWYENIIKRWSSVFGLSKIKVRTLDDSYLIGGGVLPDFQDATGLRTTGQKIPEINENRSMPASMIEFVRRLNFALRDEDLDSYDKAAISAITQPTAKSAALKGRKFNPSRSEAHKFYSQFRDSNSSIAQTYLNRELLFTEDFITYPTERVIPTDAEVLSAGLEFLKAYILKNLKKY